MRGRSSGFLGPLAKEEEKRRDKEQKRGRDRRGRRMDELNEDKGEGWRWDECSNSQRLTAARPKSYGNISNVHDVGTRLKG
ncbi:hypothetical protein J3E68DRAFT_301582 [Trichoderma sp. SZMC 28012]